MVFPFASVTWRKVENWRKSLYYHFYEYPAEHSVKRHYGVRTERYKLIHFYNDIDKWELFDLQEDPMEMNNLYGKTGYENITHQLERSLYVYKTISRHECHVV